MIRSFFSKAGKAYLQRMYNMKNRKMFANYFLKVKRLNKIGADAKSSQSRKEWMKKWSVFGEKPVSLGYQVFSHFLGENVNFVPNEIARNFIEPVLTPGQYQPFYNDKNSFNLFLDADDLPKTYYRSINGMLYDGDYNYVPEERFLRFQSDIQKIVVKPSLDMGGKGVSLFCKSEDKYVDDAGHVLSLHYLKEHYHANYLVQECVEQNEFMSQFNRSSINTLRIAAYREVTTGRIVILGALLRIGKKGSFVDNITSGGAFVQVDQNGKLGKKVMLDLYGGESSVYNAIDFTSKEFVIPDYLGITLFVEKIVKKMPHMSLFAADVIIDKQGNPKLMEINTTHISCRIFQFFQPMFGKYTDDLISFCLREKEKVGLKSMVVYEA